jgi:hypothetical protein
MPLMNKLAVGDENNFIILLMYYFDFANDGFFTVYAHLLGLPGDSTMVQVTMGQAQ